MKSTIETNIKELKIQLEKDLESMEKVIEGIKNLLKELEFVGE